MNSILFPEGNFYILFRHHHFSKHGFTSTNQISFRHSKYGITKFFNVSSQHALFKLSQAWQEELDKSGFVGTIQMDLSKTYDSTS